MTSDEQTLADIRFEIAKLSEHDQIRVWVIAATLRNIIKADPYAPMALALVGAELAAQS